MSGIAGVTSTASAANIGIQQVASQRAHALQLIGRQVGGLVAAYKWHSDLVEGWIRKEAQEVMSRDNFERSNTIRGWVTRVSVITDPSLRRVQVPAHVLNSLRISVMRRDEVGEFYQEQLRRDQGNRELELANARYEKVRLRWKHVERLLSSYVLSATLD